MDAIKPDIPNVHKLESKLRNASVEHDDGKRYVRAATAARIIGVDNGHQTAWVRHGRIKPLRFRVPSQRGAINGLVVVWPLDQCISAARQYWSGGRKWSSFEEDYLLNKIGKMPLPSLAKKLGRSVEAITQRARRLGVNQYNAQGELTVPAVAEMCGVSRAAVGRVWCQECKPPLTAVPVGDAKGTRTVSGPSLQAFFKHHPEIYDRRSDAAKRRIARYIYAGGPKAVAG